MLSLIFSIYAMAAVREKRLIDVTVEKSKKVTVHQVLVVDDTATGINTYFQGDTLNLSPQEIMEVERRAKGHFMSSKIPVAEKANVMNTSDALIQPQ